MRFVLGGLLVLLVFVSAPVAQAQTYSPAELLQRELLLRTIELLQAQIAALQEQLHQAQAARPSVSYEIDESDGLLRLVDVERTYRLRDGSFSISDAEAERYFNRVLQLFPTRYENQVVAFVVFDADSAVFDAFVETLPPTHDVWLYAASDETISYKPNVWDDQLIVHELAHLISYDGSLGYEISSRSCHEYFDDSCPSSNSPLGEFIAAFWDEQDLDRALRFADSDRAEDLAYEYYEDYPDAFVSDYAAVAPEEDFAETFMYFVFDEEVPQNSLAARKIAFMERDSELRRIKAAIVAEL